jgi:hypothetical protein
MADSAKEPPATLEYWLPAAIADSLLKLMHLLWSNKNIHCQAAASVQARTIVKSQSWKVPRCKRGNSIHSNPYDRNGRLIPSSLNSKAPSFA